MKIPKRLSNFKNKKSLILNVSDYGARFYHIYDDQILELKPFRLKKPKYSDKEGFFISRGSAGIYKSGSVYEPKKQKIKDELIGKLVKGLKDILTKNITDEIYLICPEHLKNEIKNNLPAKAKKKINVTICKNYHFDSYLKLLEKIDKNFRSAKKKSTPKSAKKILKKSKIARRVIKG